MSGYPTELAELQVGVVGLGLMGSSIAVALLIAGHKVHGVEPLLKDAGNILSVLRRELAHAEDMGILNQPIDQVLQRLTVGDRFEALQDCQLVMECVVEQLEIKSAVYGKIADQVRQGTVISSNTSAIPISVLQQYVSEPARFLGIHWAEPAYTTRFLEITCGSETDMEKADWVFGLAHLWGKEPTLLKKDIRGFITNRLMYAVYREAFGLLDGGGVTMEDIDKAFKYDVGSWITFMGVFRRMDYVGLQDYYGILERIIPQLSNAEHVPGVMQEMVDRCAKGIHNGIGLYDYGEVEGREWGNAFAAFSKDIFKLASQYVMKDILEDKL